MVLTATLGSDIMDIEKMCNEVIAKPAYDFQNIVDDYVDELSSKEDKSFWRKEKNRYHVSYGSKCTRDVFYSYLQKKEFGCRTKRNFRLGHIMEDIMEGSLKNAFGAIENSVVLEKKFDGYDIVGETDPVLKVGNTVLDMFEIKSTGFSNYKKDRPNFDHILQVHGYMGLLGLDGCNIIYVDKKDLSVVPHKVNFSNQLFELWKSRIDKLHAHLKEHTLPDKNPVEDYQCKYCSYKKICKDDSLPEKDEPLE